MNYEKKHPILQKLEEYFKNTSKEQIDKDWSNILKDTDCETYYEEKYNKALERAKYALTTNMDNIGAVNYIFPEFAESVDERIRKELIEHIKANKGSDFVLFKRFSPDDVIAWLEKSNPVWSEEDEQMILSIEQVMNCASLLNIVPEKIDNIKSWLKSLRPQKQWKPSTAHKREIDDAYLQGICDAKHEIEKQGEPTDKVEPKFHEGDWIISNNKKSIYQVIEVKRGIYVIRDNVDNHEYHIGIEECEKSGRLFTINDAKDGDVLFHSDSASNGIFIFKEILQRGTIQEVVCYCDYDSEDGFCLGEKHTCCWTDSKILHPASKEQRDLLFQKMKNAGYEWNAEKKELKKMKVLNKENEDEKIKKAIHIYLDWLDGRKDYQPKGVYTIRDMIDWIIKQDKKISADKVIEWLKNTIKVTVENYGVYNETRLTLPYNSIEELINDFKKDFEI